MMWNDTLLYMYADQKSKLCKEGISCLKCLFRPTLNIFWFPVYLQTNYINPYPFFSVFFEICFFACIYISFILDLQYYEQIKILSKDPAIGKQKSNILLRLASL